MITNYQQMEMSNDLYYEPFMSQKLPNSVDSHTASQLSSSSSSDEPFIHSPPNSPIDSCGIDFTRPHVSRNEIEKLVGFRVRDTNIYLRAFVHKSVLKYIKNQNQVQVQSYMKKSNETSEFGGDAALGFIVADYLIDKYPNEDEGFLTRLRTKIVNGKSLAEIAKMLNLGSYVLMSQHVEKNNGRDNCKILEDAFEALLYAIYKDLGFMKLRAFIHKMLDNYIDFNKILKNENYKDILLRYCQARAIELPIYETINCTGPPHNIKFTRNVIINGTVCGEGTAKSKKDAEQIAAKQAIKKLGIVDTRQV